MDAKSRANFINSVADGKVRVCQKCQLPNEPNSIFCASCGQKLQEETKKQDASPFATVEATKKEKILIETQKSYSESDSVFAKGLPEWSIEPPQIMIRRKK